MFLLSCLLSLITIASAQTTQVSYGNMVDEARINNCREICKQLRAESPIEGFLPNPYVELNQGMDMASAVASCWIDTQATLNYIQDFQDHDSNARIFYNALWPAVKGYGNALMRHSFIMRHAGFPVPFNAGNEVKRATDNYKKCLEKKLHELKCPPCDELLDNDDSDDIKLVV